MFLDEKMRHHSEVVTGRQSSGNCTATVEKYWSTAVAVGDREWLAGYVTERNLKRHRIIEAGNACYLKGIGRESA